MLNRQAAVIEDIYADDRIPHDAYRRTFVKSLVMVPIRTESPIGAIGNYWAKLHKATPHEIEVLQALANTSAVALESVALYNELERRVNERTLQLAQTNQELEAFSYSVSHDLRAPLRQIDAFVAALEHDYGANWDETGRGYLSRIQGAIGEMSRLIDNLLRLSLPRGEVKTAKLDLSAVVRDVCDGLRASDPQRKVQFVIEENVEASADHGLLRAAIENLLSNAWKYSGKTENAVIEFGTKPAENGKVYFVRDNGAGFNMKHAGSLFTPFQRLHSAAEFPGNGIGLATVRRIVGRHGGSTWAESEPGKGATFYFTLAA
jgi:light-regulated signal transduction histidine kinase (bacteriophytochrome)